MQILSRLSVGKIFLGHAIQYTEDKFNKLDLSLKIVSLSKKKKTNRCAVQFLKAISLSYKINVSTEQLNGRKFY